MDIQKFIDSHQSWLPVVFPVYFVGLWCTVAATISYVGGWHALAERFQLHGKFNGISFAFQSGQMRWLANYGSCLTLGANQEGLYLAVLFLFRPMHPPLLVPWSEVRVRRRKRWIFGEYVTFTMGRELDIPLRISSRTANKLRTAAWNHWPIEET